MTLRNVIAADVMAVHCPVCSAMEDQPCIVNHFRNPKRWHLQRRLDAEAHINEKEALEDEGNLTFPKSTFYSMALITKNSEVTTRGDGATVSSTAHSGIIRRLEARSDLEAIGIAFLDAIKTKRDFSVYDIKVMYHDPRGPGLDLDQ